MAVYLSPSAKTQFIFSRNTQLPASPLMGSPIEMLVVVSRSLD